MTRFRLCLMFVLVSTAGFLLTLNGCGGSAKSLSPNPPLIQHIVVIFQENRTPDNLFQDPVLVKNGADIHNSGVNSQGQTIPLSPIDLGTTGSDPRTTTSATPIPPSFPCTTAAKWTGRT